MLILLKLLPAAKLFQHEFEQHFPLLITSSLLSQLAHPYQHFSHEHLTDIANALSLPAVGRMLALGCCHPGLLCWVQTTEVLALVAHRMSCTLATAAKAFSLPGQVLERLFTV